LGRSSAARSGRTCPPWRTVRSIPPNPILLAAWASRSQFIPGKGFEKRQRVPV